MKEFFRFSIRQFLFLVVCMAICIAVNRDRYLGDFLEDYGDFLLCMVLVLLSPPMILIFVRLYQTRDRPEPPARSEDQARGVHPATPPGLERGPRP
jgi:hypothetical protein